MSSFFFFGTIMGIYASINAYLFVRLWLTLAGSGPLRGVACALLLLFALCFPLGRIFEDRLPHLLAEVILVMGSLYIAPMIYGFLLTLLSDTLRLVNYSVSLTPMPPPFTVSGRVRVVAAVFALSLFISLLGAINARLPGVRSETVASFTARAGNTSMLRIAVLSDIHLGRMVGNGHLEKLVGLINERNPDLVLMAGDIIDDTEWIDDEQEVARTRELLSSLRPRLGVWAVPGNHEYYAGIDRSIGLLADSGVRVLRDEWALLDEGDGIGGYLLVGRDDRSAARFGASRRTLADILEEAKSLRPGLAKLPVILMDHQPFHLDEAEEAGVTLQVSGHTHRGQIFPFNFVVSSLYECPYGLYKWGKTWYYVSSGAGTWGPPVRTTGRPEIVMISLAFGADASRAVGSD